MKVIINNQEYDDVNWFGNGFEMETEMTLAEIEAAFVPGVSSNIIVLDGSQEIARYYNKGLESITVREGDSRFVTVIFNVTQITENAETEIRESLEDSDGAIGELAFMVSDLAELGLDKMAATLQSHQETLDTWFSHSSQIIEFINNLRAPGGILDQFDARITALEHEVGIVSVEANSEEEE